MTAAQFSEQALKLRCLRLTATHPCALPVDCTQCRDINLCPYYLRAESGRLARRDFQVAPLGLARVVHQALQADALPDPVLVRCVEFVQEREVIEALPLDDELQVGSTARHAP